MPGVMEGRFLAASSSARRGSSFLGAIHEGSALNSITEALGCLRRL